MSADGLLDRLIVYSLFRRDVLSTEEDLRALQGDYFGVFVTIRRAHRLGTWPDDIHGCIGHWHPSYEALSPEELMSHALDVGSRAMWEDSRRHRFDHFVDRDPDTWLELDLMRRPLYPVRSDTGLISLGRNRTVPFTNDTYGLIVQHSDGARATYLPHVFDPSMPWVELRDHLISKAGITDHSGITFYAYEITQYKRQLHHVLDANRVGATVTRDYVRRLMDEKNDQRRYPFLYQVNQKGRRQFEEHEEVRNLSTLMGLLRYDDAYGGGLLRPEEREWLRRRCDSVLSSQIQTLSPQALSFAGYVVQKYVPAQQGIFCQRLLQALPHAEPEFERGEILLGLHAAGCKGADTTGLDVHDGDSIFKMNWTVQAMIAWGKSVTASQRSALLSAAASLGAEAETNQLAVAWEALAAVYSVSREKAVKDLLFALFFHLERRRTADGFYAFLRGDARIDITDHVLRGYLYLKDSVGSQRGGKYRKETRSIQRKTRRRFKRFSRKQSQLRRK